MKATEIEKLLKMLTPSQIQMLVGYEKLLTFRSGFDGSGNYPVDVNTISRGVVTRTPATVHVHVEGDKIVAELRITE